MAAVRPQAWPFATILNAIRDKLNTDIYGEDSLGQCYIGRHSSNAVTYTSSPYLILTPSGIIVDDDFVGSGIWYTGIRRVIQITIAIRTTLDVAGEAKLDWTSTLEDNNILGLAWIEEQVINSLHLVNVQNDDGKNLLNQPMRLIPNNPDYNIDIENPAQDIMYSTLSFMINYGYKTSRDI